jgi:hypothetical protein
MRAELRADGVEHITTSADDGNAIASIRLDSDLCDPALREAVVIIEDRLTSKRVSRRVALGDLPPLARPRTLALATAELLRASWLELATPDAPPPTVPVPAVVRDATLRRLMVAPPPPAELPRPEPKKPLDVSLAFEWRTFPIVRTSMLGGRGAIAIPFYTRSLWFRLDLGALVGSARDVLGDVALGYASGGAALFFATPRERAVSAEIGPRVEYGVAWAHGSPIDQSTSSFVGSGYVATTSLVGAFHVRITDSWRVAMQLAGGAALTSFEARADSRRVAGLEGGMFGFSIGLAQLR